MSGRSQFRMRVRRYRWPARLVALAMLSVLIGTATVAAAFAGIANVLPIGFETELKDGTPQWFLVINPAEGTEAPDCPDGALKVTIPMFALVRSQPAVYGTTLGTSEQGQIMCVLSVNNDGWSEVRWGSGQPGWVEPGTFRTVRVPVAEGATQDSEAGQDAPQTQPTPTPIPAAPPPAPSGGIIGGGGVVVSQSLTVRAGQVMGANGLVTVNDEGSAFTVALETTVGATSQVRLMLRNASGSPLNGNIQLQLPAGFQVGAARNDGVTQLGQIAADTWLFTLAGSHSNLVWDVQFTIKASAEVPPGFSGFKGIIKQVAG
ncbi:MAG: SH3 domain-containing protein [Chloroflexi bacterium]|nr:SH3 domain-containing protein [Chloroflexota bacterium]